MASDILSETRDRWRVGRRCANEFAAKRGAAARDLIRKSSRNPGCPLGLDYRQVGSAHVLIGDRAARRAKSQRDATSGPTDGWAKSRQLLSLKTACNPPARSDSREKFARTFTNFWRDAFRKFLASNSAAHPHDKNRVARELASR